MLHNFTGVVQSVPERAARFASGQLADGQHVVEHVL